METLIKSLIAVGIFASFSLNAVAADAPPRSNAL